LIIGIAFAFSRHKREISWDTGGEGSWVCNSVSAFLGESKACARASVVAARLAADRPSKPFHGRLSSCSPLSTQGAAFIFGSLAISRGRSRVSVSSSPFQVLSPHYLLRGADVGTYYLGIMQYIVQAMALDHDEGAGHQRSGIAVERGEYLRGTNRGSAG
jgi:nucleoside permease NupC